LSAFGNATSVQRCAQQLLDAYTVETAVTLTLNTLCDELLEEMQNFKRRFGARTKGRDYA